MDFQVSALAYVISADGGSRGKEAAARNLEFPLVIKSYPLQSRDIRVTVGRAVGEKNTGWRRERWTNGGVGKDGENFARRGVGKLRGLKEEDGNDKVHGPVIIVPPMVRSRFELVVEGWREKWGGNQVGRSVIIY